MNGLPSLFSESTVLGTNVSSMPVEWWSRT